MVETKSPFLKMMEVFHSPVVQDFLHHVQGVTGFSLPPSVKQLFESYHIHCFDPPRPEFYNDVENENPNSKWQKAHSESVFSSAQSAVSAVYYHRENLLRLERDVLSFIDRDKLIKIVGRTAMGGGNTQKLDFEYHSFVFAYRRSLDYLARGIAALLKEDFHSFRRLPRLQNNHSACAWFCEILIIYAEYAPQLKSFIGAENERSVRDKVAHYLHVPAGALNVNANGIFFASGGENLDHSTRLKDVIDKYTEILVKIFDGCIAAMTKGNPKNA